jgi:hypothetical protein
MQAEEAKERRETGIFWAGHQAGLAYYSQSARLASPDRLPPTGFTVACFPLRLVGGERRPSARRRDPRRAGLTSRRPSD